MKTRKTMRKLRWWSLSGIGRWMLSGCNWEGKKMIDLYRAAALEMAEKEDNLSLMPIILLAMMEGAKIALNEAARSMQ